MSRLRALLSGSPLWTAIVLLLLVLPAIQPFTLGRLPQSADGILHLYRILTLEHDMSTTGTLWPRYSASLVAGYGAPLFNYYSPQPYQIPALLTRIGITPAHSFLLALAAYTLLGAAGAYHLGRVWSTRAGGLVTAAAYAYAPYTLVNAVARGTLTEMAGLAILPWLLWLLWGLAAHGRARDLLLAALTCALFILQHNIITVYGSLLLIVYGLLLIALHPARPRTLLLLALAGGCGLLMAAFFWLPALLETRFVNIDGVSASLDFIDVTRSLRGLDEVLALPVTADPTQANQNLPISLSWPALLLALVGLVTTFRHGGHRIATVTLALVTALLVFMNLPASAPLWELPLIRYSQFAWRTLGVASLLLALLAGVGAAGLLAHVRPSRAPLLLAGLLLMVTLPSLPWLYRPYRDDVDPRSIRDAQALERETSQLALSSYSEYTPVWMQQTHDLDALQTRWESADVIPRLVPPPGLNVISAEWEPTAARLTVQTDEPTSLTFDWLYVPGWQVTVSSDDLVIPADVRPAAPDGRVQVELPAGRWAVDLRLEPTDVQRTSGIISLAGLALLIVAAGLWRRWQPASEQRSAQAAQPGLITAAALVGLGVFAGKALLLDHFSSPIRHERFAQGEAEVSADFGGFVTLIGLSPELEAVRSGQEARISLFWRLTDGVVADDYASLVQLRDISGAIISESAAFMPGGMATSSWLPGTYVRDDLWLMVPDGTPPGGYSLEAGLYDAISGQRLSARDASGAPVGVAFRLGELEVLPPDAAPQLAASGLRLGDLSLLSLEGLPDTADVGAPLTLSWLWQADVAPGVDLSLRLIWQQDGETVAMTPALPISHSYPSSQWQPGDVWRGWALTHVPGALESGAYDLALALERDGQVIARSEVQWAMTVRAPQRVYALPEPQHSLGLSWQNGLQLLGYDLDDAGDSSTLTLYWQTTQPIDRSLHLFVHRLDADEQIIAQSDGMPADWTRPTTGWAVGEVVTTQHRLNADGEGFRLGWYDPLTGQRELLSDGGDALRLP